jgi:hypothetical protein
MDLNINQRLSMRYKNLYSLQYLHVLYSQPELMYSQHSSCTLQARKKAEALKDNRDYSFLLSDDADLPPSPKGKPAARPSLNQNSSEFIFDFLKKCFPCFFHIKMLIDNFWMKIARCCVQQLRARHQQVNLCGCQMDTALRTHYPLNGMLKLR